MAYWKKPVKGKKTLRTKSRGNVTKRKVGVRNLTDAEAKREGKGKGRVKNYVNTTDGAKRVSHKRKPRSLW